MGTTTTYLQRHLDQVLQGLPYCGCYIDEIIIWSSTIEKHFIHLHQVLQRLQQAGLNSHPNKCVFNTNYIKFLGQHKRAEHILEETQEGKFTKRTNLQEGWECCYHYGRRVVNYFNMAFTLFKRIPHLK